jgi:hypothetical protein
MKLMVKYTSVDPDRMKAAADGPRTYRWRSHDVEIIVVRACSAIDAMKAALLALGGEWECLDK